MAKKPVKTSSSNGQIPDATLIEVAFLHFDASNPRLIETTADGQSDDDEIIRVLWRETEVEEIVLSIAAQGYFRHGPCSLSGQAQKGMSLSKAIGDWPL